MVEYIDFITPDWVFNLGPEAVGEWQSAYKRLVKAGKGKEAQDMQFEKLWKAKGE